MTVTVFLKLTDYIEGSDLCELSPDTLQSIVCGSDGLRLERIRKSSEVKETRFISAPFPGFYVKSSRSSTADKAVAQLEGLMREIRKAAADQANSSSTCSNSSSTTPAVSAPENRQKSQCSFKNAFYHPLYSASQYHLMPGLLPTPVADQSAVVAPTPMSDEECERILSSPYLSAWKRRSSSSRETSSAKTCNEAAALFDKELEGCLPGLPGVRQSKEYKRIRRKISEIDDLLKSGVCLDACQKSKVSKRPDYVYQLRHMLVNGIEEQKPSEDCVCHDHEHVTLPPQPDATDPSNPVSDCPCCDSLELKSQESVDTATAIALLSPAPVALKAVEQRRRTKAKPRQPVVVLPSKLPLPAASSAPAPETTALEELLFYFLTIVWKMLAALKCGAEVWTHACCDFFIGFDQEYLMISTKRTVNVVGSHNHSSQK